MSYLFTSESVSEGHPDKVADQISDTLVDNFIAWDPQSKVACETLVTTGQVIIAGEVKSNAYLDVQKLARETIEKIGYTKPEYMFEAKSCGVLSAIHEQSTDINRGVDREKPEDQGAGDQGIMFGYASHETDNYLPLPLSISHAILREMARIRKETDLMPYLAPDSKAQVTIEYSDDNKPLRIDNIVVSTQHDDFIEPASLDQKDIDSAERTMLAKIKEDVINIVIPTIQKQFAKYGHLFDDHITYHVNPTGKFVIGGPHGDTGLTGRKIIVDTYGGKGAHGGGAFSGKDPSKVDRSAAYEARRIAKNLVAAGVCDEALVQLSYAIGVADPCGLYVNTYGTSHVDFTDGEIAAKLMEMMSFRPYDIEQRLKLREPKYEETASYGHFGREPRTVTKTFERFDNGQNVKKSVEVELFTWEKLDLVDQFKSTFGV